MRLRSLTINTLPGIEPGFAFHAPNADTVLVAGPNAIGKSSLARALRHLLVGVRKSDPKALSLEAAFDSAAGRWTVIRNGSEIVWRRDGAVADNPPPLPTADQLGHYRLSMESLLADDAGDRELAERIHRQLRGGFDLDAAHPEYAPGKAQSAKRKLQKQQQERRKIEGGYRQLREQEQQLPALERRIADARKARQHCDAIDNALKLHDALRAQHAAQAAFDRFAPGMAKLRGDELDKLDQLDAKAAKLASDLRREQDRLADAEQALEATGLADAALTEEHIRNIERVLNDLDKKVLKREPLASDHDKASAALHEAAARFGTDDTRQPQFTPDAFKHADQLIDPLLEAQQHLRALESAIVPDAQAPEAWRLERLGKAADALRNWLAASAAGSHRQASAQAWKRSRLASLATAALIGAAAFAAFLSGGYMALILASAAALAATLLAFACHRRAQRERAEIDKPLDEARNQFDATGEPPPVDWHEQDVREHLQQKIEEPLHQLHLRQQEAAAADAKRRDIEQRKEAAQQRLNALEAQRAALAERIGFDPHLPIAAVRHFAQAADAWHRARSDCEQIKERLGTVDAGIAADEDRARRLLERWQRSDGASLADAADALRQRLTQAQDAQRRIAGHQQAAASKNRELEGVQDDRRALFDGAGLEPNALAELADRLQQLDAWRAAKDALSKAQHEAELARQALGDDAELAAQAADDAARPQLEGERSQAGAQAAELSELLKELGALRQSLDAAGRQHALEQALGEEDAARQALAEARTAALHREAADILLDDVKDTFRNEHEPALLHRARERFAQTTAHAFTLELHDAGNATGFAAQDTKQEQSRPLDALSTGTRMQLLLAVRLAWIEEQEQARGIEPLPLFLDEALATSDEARFSAMAQSLVRLAADSHRQMFLLSARSHEDMALWRRATGTEPAVVDLAQVRFGIERPASDFALPPRPALPAPDDCDAERYAAQLGVPPANPRRIAGLHPFHLLRDDLALLHRLLSIWRIDSLGPLQRLLASNAADTAIGTQQCKHLALRCRAAQHWAALWQQGRGKPVDRVALEGSDAVSDAFMAGATELAEQHAGDAAALIEALRTGALPRFRASKIDALESWLETQGYLDAQEPLTQQQRHTGTLEKLAPPTPAAAADIAATLEWLEAGLPRQ